jgi:hypothetical protein
MLYVSFTKLHSGIHDRSHIWGGRSHGLNSAFVGVVCFCGCFMSRSFLYYNLFSDLHTVSLFHENGMHWMLVFLFFVWPCDRLQCVLDRGFVVKGSICFYNLSLSAASAAHVSMYQRVKNTLFLTTTKPLYKSNSYFGSCLQYPRVNQIPTLI